MQRLIAAWSGLEQHVVDNAINEWRGRLRASVRAGRQHFEHLLSRKLFFLSDLLYCLFYNFAKTPCLARSQIAACFTITRYSCNM